MYRPTLYLGSRLTEYMAVKLIQPLLQDSSYKLTMYVSLRQNYTDAAVSNIGFIVASDSVHLVGNGTDLNLQQPFVKMMNDTNNIINNKGQWEKLEYTFTANGGERYLYLGNMDPDSMVHALFLPGALDTAIALSYYMVDNVSLVGGKKGAVTGINQVNASSIKIYPNPAQENVNITLPEGVKKAKLLIYNTQGQMLRQENVNASKIIDVSDFANGLYLFFIQSHGNIEAKEKIIIAH